MSLLVAIQSAIFYYVACTPCNEARARHKTKQQAKKDKTEKMRIQMEQPGLYAHPSPFHTNPYWQEEIDIGPRLPKNKSSTKNASQRGLNSSSTGRNSTTASLTCTSSNENNTTNPTTPTMIPEDAADGPLDEGWNKHRYQREDEELWGHNVSHIGHRLVDNIVKAGNSAGRMIKGEGGKERMVTEDERSEFYFTPRNPPINDYHPPIVGSAPSHKGALQWMLQPPPSAKVMEGRVPVNRAQSFGSMASRNSRASQGSAGRGARPAIGGEPGLGRLARERAMQERLRHLESPSETELIDALIGTRSRQTTVSSRGRSMRSRSLSMDSEKLSDRSTDGERADRKRRSRMSARPPMVDSDDSDTDDDHMLHPGWELSKGSMRGPGRTAVRPKLGTIRSEDSRTNKRTNSNYSHANRQESLTPRAVTPSTPPRMPDTKATSDHIEKDEVARGPAMVAAQ